MTTREVVTCAMCSDTGMVPVDACTCGDGVSSYGHESGCGFEPCLNGCPTPLERLTRTMEGRP